MTRIGNKIAAHYRLACLNRCTLILKDIFDRLKMWSKIFLDKYLFHFAFKIVIFCIFQNNLDHSVYLKS